MDEKRGAGHLFRQNNMESIDKQEKQIAEAKENLAGSRGVFPQPIVL